MNRRIPALLLFSSIALNVFLAGGVIGAFIWYKTGEPAASERRGIRFAAARLQPEQRKEFRQALAQTRKISADLISDARQGRARIATLLESETLDTAAIDAEFTKVRAADMAIRTRIEQTVIGFMQALPAADRKVLVDGLRQRAMLRQPPAENN